MENINKINPILVRMQESEKGIIYQSIVAMSMRSRQVNDDIKNEIADRMSDIIIDPNDTEGTNFDQIAISREFDTVPKPTFIAMQEILDKKMQYDLPADDQQESSEE